ncbi:MAG TPA: hypothetical protein VJM13_02820 [Sphingopyxis sp.]|nr:hypothetical protein [Sphingopyxis sp.]
MDLLILATLALAAIIVFRLTRRTAAVAVAGRSAPVPTVDTTPRRITSPRRAGRPDVNVWILRACPQCDLTHSLLNGHRYLTAEAPTLPGMGCQLSSCECRYEPVRDTRRGERREGEDRRDAIRFESKRDRRLHPDRRESDGWRHANHHH